MIIEEFVKTEDQVCNIGKHQWSVARLFELSKNLPVMEINIDHLYVYHLYEKLTLREMVMHMNAVNSADLSFPIILDEDGDLMDGRHRIMKVMLTGKKTIKAVRFDKNPYPCKVINQD